MRVLGLMALLALQIGCAQRSVHCETSLRPINPASDATAPAVQPPPGAPQGRP